MIRRLDKQDRIFRALGHATRREILDQLRAAPRTTGELCGHFDKLDRCTVMQHLGVLERADLVAELVGLYAREGVRELARAVGEEYVQQFAAAIKADIGVKKNDSAIAALKRSLTGATTRP